MNTRALLTRVAKLEAKHRLWENDIRRLSDEELEALIRSGTETYIAQHGSVQAAIEAARNDPENSEHQQDLIKALEEYRDSHAAAATDHY
jgi:phosphodiesterase/alkaline phosphatase D-like protein